MNELANVRQSSLLAEVVNFIWREAEYLDDQAYDAWLALWATGGYYTMPIGDTPADRLHDALNLCHDDEHMRLARVTRFKEGFSISSAPPAQTIRTLSRFRIISDDGEAIHVRCSQHLVEDKFGRQRLFAANVSYRLRRDGDGFLIQDKIVRLLNSEGVLTSFSYLF